MTALIRTLCEKFPNGWTHEDALEYSETSEIIFQIRHEATEVDGILKETNGSYTLRSK